MWRTVQLLSLSSLIALSEINVVLFNPLLITHKRGTSHVRIEKYYWRRSVTPCQTHRVYNICYLFTVSPTSIQIKLFIFIYSIFRMRTKLLSFSWRQRFLYVLVWTERINENGIEKVASLSLDQAVRNYIAWVRSSTGHQNLVVVKN